MLYTDDQVEFFGKADGPICVAKLLRTTWGKGVWLFDFDHVLGLFGEAVDLDAVPFMFGDVVRFGLMGRIWDDWSANTGDRRVALCWTQALGEDVGRKEPEHKEGDTNGKHREDNEQ